MYKSLHNPVTHYGMAAVADLSKNVQISRASLFPRIGLSTVINKYIGETEKNLSRVFEEPAITNFVLFFDEAHSVSGKRREVKDTRDRYANTKTNHLPQEMERHGGMVILTTNPRENIGARCPS